MMCSSYSYESFIYVNDYKQMAPKNPFYGPQEEDALYIPLVSLT